MLRFGLIYFMFLRKYVSVILKGSLAQLVQSICLTSRGSGVRTPQLPLKPQFLRLFLFWCVEILNCIVFQSQFLPI